MPDMLVKLYDMPKIDTEKRMKNKGVIIKRAMALDKERVKEFAKTNFGYDWENECERAIFNSPSSCYIAVKDKEIVGFACYDATTLGFFGPTGVAKKECGKGIGKALLSKCLESMKEKGYGYAIIGYVTDAVEFYIKACGAQVIEGTTPEKSIYSNLVRL
ncbi:MAG: GNAT family N-acetyltransferase [Defluviitaleaceae bacterium]|nr:GNAT family N-acetyltransferase [Defluviitaleaceae bacterium]